MPVDSFEVPASIAALGPDVVERVEELVVAAERRQAQEQLNAAESSLGLVPRPVRPIVRKVLGL